MRRAKITDSDWQRSDSPALTPEAREQQMIAKAERLAERQLEDGTASAQVITHYLKLATTRERIEREILEKQKELITAKTEALQSAAKIEQMFEEATAMFRKYSGQEDTIDDSNIH